MIAAPIGAQATQLVAPRVLLLLFAALMIVVGGPVLRGRRPAPEPSPRPRHRLALAGAGLGVGLLIVPALTLLGGLSIHAAVGSSLVVIALTAVPAERGPAAPPPRGPRLVVLCRAQLDRASVGSTT